jgi:hypothetical protein
MLGSVAQIDLIEETFVAASPALVAEAVRDPAVTRALWPDLELSVFMDRGDDGLRWSATGALTGSCEIWLEPYGDGVVAHTYLRTDLTAPGAPATPVTVSWRAAAQEIQRRARHAKKVWWQLKDAVEGGRRPGEPATGVPAPAPPAKPAPSGKPSA